MSSQQQLNSVEAIWRRYDADEQRLTAPVSVRMLELAQLCSGMQVLDLATGRGEPANRLLQYLPQETQTAWEYQLVSECIPLRDAQGTVRLGGVTRLVVAQVGRSGGPDLSGATRP